MNTEIFEGDVEDLKVRLDALIAGPATSINQVVLAVKGKWLIIWS